MIHYRDGRYTDGPVHLDAAGEAFKYGFGIFDTLRWDADHVCRLREHLERDRASLTALGVVAQECDYARVIPEVASRNGLVDAPGRINIHFPVEDGRARPVISASSYAPPPAEATLRLAVSPHASHTWLAAHKTTNYLTCHLAQRRARAAGYDGAVFLSPEGHVLEAATAALLFATEETWITPCSPTADAAVAAILPSVALRCAREVLPIVGRPVHLRELAGFTHAWALNSLMGMRPLTALEEVRWDPDFAACAMANQRILRA